MGNKLKKFIVGKDDEELLKEIKTSLKLTGSEEVKLFSEANRYAVIEKSAPTCFCCGGQEDLHKMGSKIILCEKCIKGICATVFKEVSKDTLREIGQQL